MKTKVKKPSKKQLAAKIESLDADEVLEFIPAEIAALALEFDLTLEQAMSDITDESNDLYSYDGEEFLILQDDEATQRNDEYIESYIDECILPELPERYRSYFDNEAFIRDARMDGRGHNLAGYDGEEREQKFNDEWYFIYRTN